MTQTDKLKNDKFMNEKMDMKRYLLCILMSIKSLALFILLGAVMGIVVYFCITRIGRKTEYEIANDYYIVFNEKDYPNGMDYYNAYTWNSFVTDDKIVDAALAKANGEFSKTDVKENVSSLMLGDYRVLTVVVKGTDKTKVEAISEAYKTAMPAFAKAVNELSSIELWSTNDIKEVKAEDKTVNVALLGAIIALLVWMFVYSFRYAMDDSIRVENDLKEGTFLGYDCDLFRKDYEANLKAIVRSENVVFVENISNELDNLKNSEGCVIKAKYGKSCMAKIKYDMELLKKNNIPCYGVVLEDVNEKFIKKYYGI